MENGVGKAVLKDATNNLVYINFFKRIKTGFTFPVNRWINNELRPKVIDTFNDKNSKNFFSEWFLEKALIKLSNHRGDGHIYLSFIFLEWAKRMQVYVRKFELKVIVIIL